MSNLNHVSFTMAHRYYEKGHVIESVESGRTFDKNDNEGNPDNAFDAAELRGLWIVENATADENHLPGYEAVKVTGARAAVRQVPVEEATKSGIILMESAKEPKFEGTIVVTGPGARLDNGVQMPMEIKAGDKVIYSRMAGVPIQVEIDGKEEELLVINERDIIAIIE